jgi:hypothetical protein
MNFYVTKPIPVSAIQWTGKNFDEILEFTKGKCFLNSENLWLKNKLGESKASICDFVLREDDGEFYILIESVFRNTYNKVEDSAEFHEFAHKQSPKSLHNTTSNSAKKNVKDIKFFGDGDMFKLLSKASSESEGFMKSTKAMEIEGVGCVVQTTTQQRNPDGSYSLTDALTFVPNCQIEVIYESGNENVVARKLVYSV